VVPASRAQLPLATVTTLSQVKNGVAHNLTLHLNALRIRLLGFLALSLGHKSEMTFLTLFARGQ
jgi:hypothetical protein